jgi:hypothetical protein
MIFKTYIDWEKLTDTDTFEFVFKNDELVKSGLGEF